MGSFEGAVVSFLLCLCEAPRLLASPIDYHLAATNVSRMTMTIPERREISHPLLLRCSLSAGVHDRSVATAGASDQSGCSVPAGCHGRDCLSLLDSGQLRMTAADWTATGQSASAKDLLICDGGYPAVFEATVLMIGDDPIRTFGAKTVTLRQLGETGYRDLATTSHLCVNPSVHKLVASTLEQCLLSSMYATAGRMSLNVSERSRSADEWRLLRVGVLPSASLSSCLTAVTDVTGAEPDGQQLLRRAGQVVAQTAASETGSSRQRVTETLLKHGFHFSGACPAGGQSCLSPAELTRLVTSFRQVTRAAGHFVRLRPNTINRVFGPELPLTLSKGAYSAAERAWLVLLDGAAPPAGVGLAGTILRQLQTPRLNGSADTGCSDDLKEVAKLAYLHMVPDGLQLEPAFSPEISTYQVKVGSGRLQVTLSARSLHCAAEVRILSTRRNTVSFSTPVGVGSSSVQLHVGLPGSGEGDEGTYRVTFHRDRPGATIDTSSDRYETCVMGQKCSLLFLPGACGPTRLSARGRTSGKVSQAPVLPLCPTGKGQPGHWELPCRHCGREESCDWSRARWSADRCRYGNWTQQQLQQAAADTQLLFLGDSTLRSVLYRAVERLNGTLSRADRTHGLLQLRVGPAGQTRVTYSYYPRFFLPQHSRPTFRQQLLQLLDRSGPVSSSAAAGRTRLVVGGVQWLDLSHLNTLERILHEQGLQNVTVIVKGHGAGFHLPGSSAAPAQARYSQLYRQNQALKRAAERRRWIFVDTLPMTLSRFNEFTQGSCACHFHTVERLSCSRYTIRGPVNEAYTNIFLHHLFG